MLCKTDAQSESEPTQIGSLNRLNLNRRNVARLTACLLLLLTFSGCQYIKNLWTPAPLTCSLPKNISKEALVAHLNQNIAALTGWSSNDATVNVSGMPIPLSGNIAVDNPQNFRLLVSQSLTGAEADFGSNNNQFWFWIRRSEPSRVFTAEHAQFETLQQKIPIPFRPDWLMEALGVQQLDARQITMEQRNPQSQFITLTSAQTLPNGQTVRHRILVNACYGRIVKRSLYGNNQQLIASAAFDDFRKDQRTGIWMPHKISLNWPQAKSQMTLKMKQITVNPASFPEKLWTVPVYKGSPELNLTQRARHQRLARQPTKPQFIGQPRPKQVKYKNNTGQARILPVGATEFNDPFNTQQPQFAEGKSPFQTTSIQPPVFSDNDFSNTDFSKPTTSNSVPIIRRRSNHRPQKSSPDQAPPFPKTSP